MGSWIVLVDITILLAGALVFGALCERYLRSAIVGYLLAGMVLGPNALEWVKSVEEVAMLAELGAALLLFSVGLEYAWTRLRALGKVCLAGGSLQVSLTALIVTGVAIAFGVPNGASVVLGTMVALSSTASALKELEDRGELESVHGEYSVGVLLIQDLAVIPFMMIATTLTQDGSDSSVVWLLLKAIGYGLAAVAGLYVLFLHIVPRFLGIMPVHGNRELSVLTAILAGLVAVIVAHEAGLSPALGAFIAGMLLAHSPFAVQVRADLSGLRTLFVTIFFSSIGAFGDPAWMFQHLGWVLLATAGLLIFKTLVTFFSLRVSGARSVSAFTASMALSQIGEFAFVIAAICRGTVITEFMFLLLISVAILSMIVTPAIISVGPRVSARLFGRPQGGSLDELVTGSGHEPEVIIIGFGPAGLVVGDRMREASHRATVLDLNPKIVNKARKFGFASMVGDGLHQDVLLHAGIRHATSVVITIPHPPSVIQIVRIVRAIAPQAVIIARSRFHRYSSDITAAGAHIVIDEETDVGFSLANLVAAALVPVTPPSEAGDLPPSNDGG